MTETKQLSLSGRLRMAAACPDANASLFAEAADAIEQHEAYKQDVSDAVELAVRRYGGHRYALDPLDRFILPKPDPLEEVLDKLGWSFDDTGPDMADDLRAALAARGLEIREKQP